MRNTFANLTLVLCSSLLLLSQACQKEKPLRLNKGVIESDFHKKHLGQITFMADYVSPEDYSEEDFIESIVLGDKTNLNIRVYLKNTLTYSLHEMAPDLTVNELCKRGHFQFKFFVDDHLIFTDNINKGAWSCDYRNELTAFRLPLTTVKEEDQWGRFMWMRFMKKGGGEKALDKGNHRLRIEIRPYIELEETIVGELVAQGEITIGMEQMTVSENEIAIQPIQATKEWIVKPNALDTAVIRNLNEKIAQNRFKNVTSIVVLKEGELLLEEYFNGANRSSLHDTRSVGKSVASALMGIAVDQKLIGSEHDKLSSFFEMDTFDNPSETKKNITLEELLTMSSSLAADDQNTASPGQEEKMYASINWMEFGLNLPIDEDFAKAASFHYNSVSASLIGGILHNQVDGGLEAFAKANLFTPLGISEYQWQYTPKGIANTAGSLGLSSLDLAKFGQLYQNKGQWDHRQIISASWIDKSLQSKVSHEMGGYGYFFWTRVITYEGINYEVAYAAGNGGNQVLIFKDNPIVIVITATAYGQPWAHFQTEEIVKDYLLPSLL